MAGFPDGGGGIVIGAPSNFMASPRQNGDIILSWGLPDSALLNPPSLAQPTPTPVPITGYTIYAITGGSSVVIATVSGTTYTYTVAGSGGGFQYGVGSSYYVSAVYSNSAESQGPTYTIPPSGVSFPDRPYAAQYISATVTGVRIISRPATILYDFSVSFQQPLSDGGTYINVPNTQTAITSYIITVNGTPTTVTNTQTSYSTAQAKLRYSGFSSALIGNSTTISLSVAAVNAVGTGPTTTMSFTFPTAPESVIGMNVIEGTSGYNVRWTTALSYITITNYSIYYSQISFNPITGDPEYTSETKIVPTSNIKKNEVIPYASLDMSKPILVVTMTASNAAGEGPRNTPIYTLGLRPPTNLIITSSSPSTATVTWSPPSGGATSGLFYRLNFTNTGRTDVVDNVTSPYTITGVVAGLVTVSVQSRVGNTGSDNSTVSGTYTLANSVPSQPQNISVDASTVDPLTAIVSFYTPSVTGGADITGYTVKSSSGDIVGSAAVPSGTPNQFFSILRNLTYQTSYTFSATAANVYGTSSKSANTLPISPKNVPGAPTSTTASAGNATASVAWTAPTDTGGLTITGYKVVVSPGGAEFTTTGATSVTCTGLTNGTSYTFAVSARNSLGYGPASAPSSPSIKPAAPPGKPVITNVTVLAGNRVQVSWTPPTTNGGSDSSYDQTITGYNLAVIQSGNPYFTTLPTPPELLSPNVYSYTFPIQANFSGSDFTIYISAKTATQSNESDGRSFRFTSLPPTPSLTITSVTAGYNQFTIRYVCTGTVAQGYRDLRITTGRDPNDLNYGTCKIDGTGIFVVNTPTYSIGSSFALFSGTFVSGFGFAVIGNSVTGAIPTLLTSLPTTPSKITDLQGVTTVVATSPTTTNAAITYAISQGASQIINTIDTPGGPRTVTSSLVTTTTGTGVVPVSDNSGLPPVTLNMATATSGSGAIANVLMNVQSGGSGNYNISFVARNAAGTVISTGLNIPITIPRSPATSASPRFINVNHIGPNGLPDGNTERANVPNLPNGQPDLNARYYTAILTDNDFVSFSQPTNLSVTYGATTATLTWTPDSSPGGEGTTTTKYQYSLNGGLTYTDFASSINLTAAPPRTGVITGLTPNTTYTIQIRPVSGGIPGNESSQTIITTLPASRSFAPTGVGATSNNATKTITVTWSAPIDNGGSPITAYIVQIGDGRYAYNPAGQSQPYTYSVQVAPGVYTVSITAINSAGESPPSQTVPAVISSTPYQMFRGRSSSELLSLRKLQVQQSLNTVPSLNYQDSSEQTARFRKRASAFTYQHGDSATMVKFKASSVVQAQRAGSAYCCAESKYEPHDNYTSQGCGNILNNFMVSGPLSPRIPPPSCPHPIPEAAPQVVPFNPTVELPLRRNDNKVVISGSSSVNTAGCGANQ